MPGDPADQLPNPCRVHLPPLLLPRRLLFFDPFLVPKSCPLLLATHSVRPAIEPANVHSPLALLPMG